MALYYPGNWGNWTKTKEINGRCARSMFSEIFNSFCLHSFSLFFYSQLGLLSPFLLMNILFLAVSTMKMEGRNKVTLDQICWTLLSSQQWHSFWQLVLQNVTRSKILKTSQSAKVGPIGKVQHFSTQTQCKVFVQNELRQSSTSICFYSKTLFSNYFAKPLVWF